MKPLKFLSLVILNLIALPFFIGSCIVDTIKDAWEKAKGGTYDRKIKNPRAGNLIVVSPSASAVR